MHSRLYKALNRLRALCDLDDLVRDAAVCLAMHRRSGFFAGSLAQTEDAARAFVVPVFQVCDPMLALNRQILLVSLFNSRGGQTLHVLVHVLVEWHWVLREVQ